MLDLLTIRQGTLYPRAVDATVQGQLQTRHHRPLTPSGPGHVNPDTASASQSTTTSQRMLHASADSFLRHREIADQLNQALQHSRLSALRKQAGVEALTSTTRRFNINAMDNEASRSLRLVDELA